MNVFATSSTNFPTADAMINADDSEFIYISGHGMKDTELWVGPLSGPTDAFAASYSANTFHTDPHSGKLYNSTKEIGVDYQDTYRNRTYSKWDDQAKWVFFAACSQLDYGSSQGLGNYWYSLSNAQIWARTMLGYRMENGFYVSKRIHGINGYHESAPAGDKATTAIDDFFDEAVKGSSFDFAADTILQSWKDGNTFLADVNWATLVHRGNANDYLPGQGTGLTANTTGTPVFDLYQNVGNRSNIWMRAPYRLGYALASTDTIPVSGEALPSKIRGKHTTFKMSKPFLPEQIDLKTLKLSSLDIDRKGIAKQLVGNTPDLVEAEDQGKQLVKNGSKSVKIYSNGAMKYKDQSKQLKELKPVSFNEVAAIAKAQKFLKDHNLLPKDAKVKNVAKTVRHTFTAQDETHGTTETVEYKVNFVHEFNGTEISSFNGEGIVVTLGADGVHNMQHFWHTIEQETAEKNKFLMPEQALEKFKEYVHKSWRMPQEAEITDFRLTYYSPDLNVDSVDTFKPAWKVEVDGNCPVLIDAVTGEQL